MKFEGGWKDGKKEGKGKEYFANGKLKFEGEYLNGKSYNGNGYDINGNIIYELNKGLGFEKNILIIVTN
jgi:antitoxin component YwqK of YwqJK toxin-antitoxin module